MLQWLRRLLRLENKVEGKVEPSPQPALPGVEAAPSVAPAAEASLADAARSLANEETAPVRPVSFESPTAEISIAVEREEAGPPMTAKPRPPSTPSPRSWVNGDRVTSLDPNQVHTALLAELHRLVDEVRAERSPTTEGDLRLVERLIQRVDRRQLDLPPFPDIARELDALLRQPDVDLPQIARVVERDPGLIRRVWTCARSAMYNTAPRSLHHAVARVGLDTLWQIGMSVCLNDTVFRVEGFQEMADDVRAHGLITADVAAALGGERRGTLYLAGLLHDVGHLIILRTAGGRVSTMRASPQMVRRVIERTHSAFGVLVADSWKLDESVAAGIGFHHAPTHAPAMHKSVASIVHAAHIAAHASQITDLSDPTLAVARQEIAALGFDPDVAISQARASWELITLPDPGPPPTEEITGSISRG